MKYKMRCMHCNKKCNVNVDFCIPQDSIYICKDCFSKNMGYKYAKMIIVDDIVETNKHDDLTDALEYYYKSLEQRLNEGEED